MDPYSIWHWIVVLLVVMLLFGGGKVSHLMGDFAKGIKAFKKNMADDGDASMEASAQQPAPAASIGSAKPAGTQAPTQANAQTNPQTTTAAHQG